MIRRQPAQLHKTKRTRRRPAKYWRRFREVFSALSRCAWRLMRSDKKEHGQHIRETLEELGPTFVKMGQLASTRPDLLPAYITKELELLQDQVPPADEMQIKATFEHAFHSAPYDVFRHIEWQPIASASIGQVHRVTLHNGEKAAVKVRRPGVVKQVEIDLEIVRRLTRLAER